MALRALAARTAIVAWRAAQRAPGNGSWFGGRPLVTQSAGESGSDDTASDTGSSGNGSSRTVVAERRAMVFPMPMLSHGMVNGRIIKWHVVEGAPVDIYDVIVTVETETLVEEAYRLGKFAGKVSLLLESQEEGFVARLLAKEGDEVAVGKPIAIFCEHAEDVPALKASKKRWADLGNVYQHDAVPALRLLEWQSYLAEGPPSNGCM